ncbi:MAG: metallophosphoesterase [Armatimonadetes bacterium]|nr:metallophosphoesterase [Armatimonadota bacterium]
MKMSRRELLGSLAAAALTAPVARGAEEEPILRFVQLNDVHLAVDNRENYRLTDAKWAAVTEEILAERHAPRPDLVLALGDMANGDKLDRLEPDNRFAAEALHRLGLPVLMTPGNHEVLQGEGDPQLEAAYCRWFGADHRTYAVAFRGVLFVLIHDAGAWAAGNETADRRNAWVADLFARYPDMPKIIGSHVPLADCRDPEVVEKSFGFPNRITRGAGGLPAIVETYHESAIAALSGHLHLSGHVHVRGVHHINVSGTASYPNHYAEYALCRDRLTVRLRRAPVEGNDRLEHSIHFRTKVFYTDHDHPTAEEYAAGRADEQTFEIALTGRRVPRPEDSLLALDRLGWPAANCRTTALGPARTRVENLGRDELVARVPFRAAGAGAVTADDGRRHYLTPGGAATWTAAELAGGVPLRLMGGEAATLDLRRSAEPDSTPVSTAGLVEG